MTNYDHNKRYQRIFALLNLLFYPVLEFNVWNLRIFWRRNLLIISTGMTLYWNPTPSAIHLLMQVKLQSILNIASVILKMSSSFLGIPLKVVSNLWICSPPAKLWEGKVFIHVCLSVHGGEGPCTGPQLCHTHKGTWPGLKFAHLGPHCTRTPADTLHFRVKHILFHPHTF